MWATRRSGRTATSAAGSCSENGCFIGSNANLVAPLTVGEGSYVAAGTTVTENVPARSFVIGRARQELNEKLAAKYVGRKRQ